MAPTTRRLAAAAAAAVALSASSAGAAVVESPGAFASPPHPRPGPSPPRSAPLSGAAAAAPRSGGAWSRGGTLSARRDGRYRDDGDGDGDGYGGGYYYNGDDGAYYGDDDDDAYETRPRRRGRRRRPADDLGTAESGTTLQVPSPFGLRSGLRLPDSVSKAFLAGIFVLGIGTGVTIESQINTSPKDLASRDAIDRNAPNPALCAQYGASAMAFDQRVFVSFNPFNVYVAQADVKPACVLRQSNVVQVLQQQRKLVNDNEIRACKRNMNTWAFVGDLDNQPQLTCVYQSEDAQNEFLSNPKLGIGEDVYDDDRAEMEKRKATGKKIKDGLTDAQMRKRAADAMAVSKFDGSLGA